MRPARGRHASRPNAASRAARPRRGRCSLHGGAAGAPLARTDCHPGGVLLPLPLRGRPWMFTAGRTEGQATAPAWTALATRRAFTTCSRSQGDGAFLRAETPCLRRGFVTRGLRRLCHEWGGWLFRSHLRTSSNCLRTSSSAGRKGVLKIEPQADSRSAVPAQSRTGTLVARSTRLALVSRECRPSSTGAWGDLAEPRSLHPTPSSQGQGSASPRARQRRPCPPRPSCAQ